MSLVQEIIQSKAREESGSKTARKYNFQKDLSLFLLLKKHVGNDDYVFLFDFHDDLVILDSSNNPEKIDFYQIKSKDSGNWTMNSLTKQDVGKLSILGKLYLNKINFPKYTQSLNFVTNANFSFDLKNGDDSKTKTEIKANELEKTTLDACDESLKKEHSLVENTEFEKLTRFQVTLLSNADSSTHCIGELSKLIHQINPQSKINSALAYTQVINEVSRRSENTISDKAITDWSELIALKGITKNQFLDFLNKAGLYKSVEDEWAEVKKSLELCSVGHLELKKYRNSWRDLSATLIKDSNKIPLQNLIKEIDFIIEQGEINGDFNDSNALLSIVNICFPKIQSTLFDDYFIKCLIIKRLDEK